MKIKYNWIILAITAIASLGLSVWQSVVNTQGGEFFLDKATYSIVIFGLTIFAFIVGAILTIIDRETPKTYNIEKNFIAGFFGLLISICYISHGVIGFMSIGEQESGNLLIFVITMLFEFLAGAVFLVESVSSIVGKNLLKNKPLVTIAVPIMFAFRLITLFFDYTKISVQSSEMFDIVAVALASLFMYYHAVMFTGLKKSCVKSLFFFGAPMVCVSLASSANTVVSAIVAKEFDIPTMLMTVSDALLCLYTISLLAEITHKVGKQYLKNVIDEEEITISEPIIEEAKVTEASDQSYSSFEEIASFGKNTPHIRRETILSEPAATVEQKEQNPDVAFHAAALHEKLISNLDTKTDSTVKEEISTRIQSTIENEVVVDSHLNNDIAFTEKNDEVKSETIPTPTQSSGSSSDGVDMDRINRLLSEIENDEM